MAISKTEGKHHKRRLQRQKNRNHTIAVRIPRSLDKALRSVCPEVDKGERCAERRVWWALREFLDSLERKVNHESSSGTGAKRY